jgi:hypothetical protein
MKNFGILILLAGLALGGYSLSMSVAVDVPARDIGFGITTPAMQVANVDRMAQRQNYMIFSGILSVVGAILLGFGSMQAKRAPADPPAPAPESATPEEDAAWLQGLIAAPNSFSVCPKCRHMGGGSDTACGRCGAALSEK